jgi:hypothetical protein
MKTNDNATRFGGNSLSRYTRALSSVHNFMAHGLHQSVLVCSSHATVVSFPRLRVQKQFVSRKINCTGNFF